MLRRNTRGPNLQLPSFIFLCFIDFSDHKHHMKYSCIQSLGLSVVGFWFVTPCGLVAGYQYFGGAYCHHLQGCK